MGSNEEASEEDQLDILEAVLADLGDRSSRQAIVFEEVNNFLYTCLLEYRGAYAATVKDQVVRLLHKSPDTDHGFRVAIIHDISGIHAEVQCWMRWSICLSSSLARVKNE